MTVSYQWYTAYICNNYGTNTALSPVTCINSSTIHSIHVRMYVRLERFCVHTYVRTLYAKWRIFGVRTYIRTCSMYSMYVHVVLYMRTCAYTSVYATVHRKRFATRNNYNSNRIWQSMEQKSTWHLQHIALANDPNLSCTSICTLFTYVHTVCMYVCMMYVCCCSHVFIALYLCHCRCVHVHMYM